MGPATMKRTAFIIILVLGSAHAGAQTLTAAFNNPVPGDQFLEHTSSVLYNPGPQGVDVTWDFSALNAVADTLRMWCEPDTTPYVASFLPATVALTSDGGNWYDYYYASTEALEYMGDAGPNHLTFYTDVMAVLKYPLSYGDAWNETCAIESDTIIWGTSVGTVEGTGTLIMPYGTVSNVVRVRLTVSINNEFTGTVVRVYHKYYKPGVHAPLLVLDQHRPPPVWIDGASMGVAEALRNAIGVEVAPVPANSSITVTFGAGGGDLEMTVRDARGALVVQRALRGAPGIMQERIDVADFAPGLYHVRVVDAHRAQGNKSFIVQ